MVWLLGHNLRLFDVFLKSANDLYELSFEDNTISDLMIREGIKNIITRYDISKANAEIWKYVSNAYIDNHLTIIDDRKGIYQIESMKIYDSCKTLKELALRDYDFYCKYISIKK